MLYVVMVPSLQHQLQPLAINSSSSRIETTTMTTTPTPTRNNNITLHAGLKWLHCQSVRVSESGKVIFELLTIAPSPLPACLPACLPALPCPALHSIIRIKGTQNLTIGWCQRHWCTRKLLCCAACTYWYIDWQRLAIQCVCDLGLDRFDDQTPHLKSRYGSPSKRWEQSIC